MRGTAAITTTTTGTTTSNLSYTTRRRRRRRRSTSTITRGFILLVVSILLLAATLRWVQAFGFFVLPSSSSRVVVRHYNPNFHSKMSVRYKLSSSPFQQTTRNRNPRLSTTTPSFMTNKKMTTSNTILPPPKQSLRQVLEVTSNTTTTTTTTNTTSNNPWIVGHRGCLYHELENTREGFWKCAAMGCDAVELDVFLLKCGTLVVFHGGGTDDATPGLLEDHCLGSTTIDQPSILDYTYAQVLEELEFDPQGSVFACPLEIFQRQGVHKVQMPTLQQVLEDAKASGMHVKIELKGEATTTTTTTPNNQNKGLVESVLALVEDTTLQMPASQISYSSFCHDYLRQLRRLRPNRQLVAIGALFTKEDLEKFPTTSALIQVALDCGATEIHLPYEECTTSRIDAIHQAGLKSMCWVKGPRGMEYDCTHVYGDVGGGNGDDGDDGDTPVVLESLELYQILMETGVQQFCINRPDILVDWRREQQQQQQGEEAMIVSSSASSSSSSFNTTTSSSTEGSVPGG